MSSGSDSGDDLRQDLTPPSTDTEELNGRGTTPPASQQVKILERIAAANAANQSRLDFLERKLNLVLAHFNISDPTDQSVNCSPAPEQTPPEQPPQETVLPAPRLPPPVYVPIELRTKDIGYFDPALRDPEDHGPKERGATSAPIVTYHGALFFRDVYVFVDRLKDLAITHGNAVKHLVYGCLRGEALMWFTTELNEADKKLMCNATLDQWCASLIRRFKTRTAEALSKLIGQKYTMRDLHQQSPRNYVLHMIRMARAAEMVELYNQLTIIWNQFHVSMRQHIPKPTPTTSLSTFLEEIDSKTSIWHELANNQTQRFQRYQQHSSQPKVPTQPRSHNGPQRSANGNNDARSDNKNWRNRGPNSPHMVGPDEYDNDPGSFGWKEGWAQDPDYDDYFSPYD